MGFKLTNLVVIGTDCKLKVVINPTTKPYSIFTCIYRINRHNITEILLKLIKVAFNTITLSPYRIATVLKVDTYN